MPEPRAQDWKGCCFHPACTPPAGLGLPSILFGLGLGLSITVPLSPHTRVHREARLTLSVTLAPRVPVGREMVRMEAGWGEMRLLIPAQEAPIP